MKNDKSKKEHFDLKNIYRSNTNKVIAGICGGLGEHFSIDPIIFRIIFVLLFINGGSGILIYFILWLIIPKEKGGELKDNVEEIKQKANEFAGRVRSVDREKRREIFGIVLVAFGALFLLDNFGIIVFDQIWRFWPVLLILIGVSILNRK